jgi:quercetin dioxygenase-like cupin family protein
MSYVTNRQPSGPSVALPLPGVKNTSRSAIEAVPGAVIPAHLHKGMAEALYIVEGDFTNEGKQYQAGTSLHFKAGKVHGPHTTKNGCRLPLDGTLAERVC